MLRLNMVVSSGYTTNLILFHILKFHIPGEKRYSCDNEDCGEKFFSSVDLANHKKKFHGDPLKCSVCSKAYNSKRSLNRHEKTHQTSLNKQQKSLISCPVCKKMFLKNSLKRHHDRIHLNLRQHSCDICGRSFYMKRRIIDHVKVLTY